MSRNRRACLGKRRRDRSRDRVATPPGPAAPGRSCRGACRCGRSPARPGCPTGTESPTSTCLHHGRHGRGDRRRIDGAPDLDPNTAGQGDLDRARQRLGDRRHRLRADLDRQQLYPGHPRRSGVASQTAGWRSRRAAAPRSTPTHQARTSPPPAGASTLPATADAWHPLP